MPDQTPITTATATVKISPDKTDWREAKREMERDIDELGERLSAAFKKAMDGLREELKSIDLPSFGRGDKGGEVMLLSSRTESAAPVADQTLNKFTEIEREVLGIRDDVRDILAALEAQPRN